MREPPTLTGNDRPAAVLTALAARLADPHDVRRECEAARAARPRIPAWAPQSLSDGHPGIALLHGRLARSPGLVGRADAESAARSAHLHLAAAAQQLPNRPGAGLYAGAPALAFAARVSAGGGTAYASLLATLDTRVVAAVDTILRAESERLSARLPAPTTARHDLIGGLAGLGRYLLGCHVATRSSSADGPLADVLCHLVRCAEPLPDPGGPMPGWWVASAPNPADVTHPQGHLNLGLAHGVAGSLALLSLAWSAGARVAEQDSAIASIAAWLDSWGQDGPDGIWWPTVVTPRQERDRSADGNYHSRRASWCYGTPGIARALQLAGLAIGERQWQDTAVRAAHRLLETPQDMWDMYDHGLCHGLAGVVQTIWRIAMTAADHDLRARLEPLVLQLADAFADETPFGYRYQVARPDDGVAADRPGLLTGAAGIALTLASLLDAESDDGNPLPWDSALLLA